MWTTVPPVKTSSSSPKSVNSGVDSDDDWTKERINSVPTSHPVYKSLRVEYGLPDKISHKEGVDKISNNDADIGNQYSS